MPRIPIGFEFGVVVVESDVSEELGDDELLLELELPLLELPPLLEPERPLELPLPLPLPEFELLLELDEDDDESVVESSTGGGG